MCHTLLNTRGWDLHFLLQREQHGENIEQHGENRTQKEGIKDYRNVFIPRDRWVVFASALKHAQVFRAFKVSCKSKRVEKYFCF